MITAVLVCAAIVLLLRIVLLKIPNPREHYYLYKIPGPWGLPLIGFALSIMALPPQGIEKMFRSLSEKYKRMVGFSLSGIVYISLFRAEDIMRLLVDKTNINKGIEYECVSNFLGKGLITGNGEQWRSDRKLINGSFHVKNMEKALPMMIKETQLLVEQLMEAQEKPVNIIQYSLVTTLNIVVESSAGIQLEEEEKKVLLDLVMRAEEKVIERITSVWKINPLLYRLAKSYREDLLIKKERDNNFHKRLKRMKKELKENADEEEPIAGPKSSDGKWKKPFTHHLLDLQKRDPDRFTDEYLKDHVLTIVTAGHETTAMCVSFLLYMLALHPDIQERCLEEIKEVVGEGQVNMNNVKDLVYMDLAIKETLRLFPTVPYFARTLDTDIVLEDGVVLPKGANVSVVPFAVHRIEKYFPDPEVFDPDRFLPERVAVRHPFSYIPFSGGPRNCIGQKFALLEVKVIACIVLKKFRVLTTTKREDIEYLTNITLKTTVPLMCSFIER